MLSNIDLFKPLKYVVTTCKYFQVLFILPSFLKNLVKLSCDILYEYVDDTYIVHFCFTIVGISDPYSIVILLEAVLVESPVWC